MCAGVWLASGTLRAEEKPACYATRIARGADKWNPFALEGAKEAEEAEEVEEGEELKEVKERNWGAR
jgi:hypothetical protein